VLTAKDVPVRAFWTIIVYDANGFIPQNDLGIYSYNDITAKPDADGSITIHLGGDPDQVNYLPIADGWKYGIRRYEPGREILDHTWVFPKIVPAQEPPPQAPDPWCLPRGYTRPEPQRRP
jgi:hypothetical protein